MTSASSDAYELIKRWESFEPEWYKCPAGIDTIGYGTTRPVLRSLGIQCGDSVSEEEASTLLRATVRQNIVPGIHQRTRPTLQQHKLDALVSFVYNVGMSAFTASTLLDQINNGREEKAEKEFEKWVYYTDPETGEKKVAEGLVSRRREERYLFERDERITVEAPDEDVEPLPPQEIERGPNLDQIIEEYTLKDA